MTDSVDRRQSVQREGMAYLENLPRKVVTVYVPLVIFLFILQPFKSVESTIHVINEDRQNAVTILTERSNMAVLVENFLNHTIKRTDRGLL